MEVLWKLCCPRRAAKNPCLTSKANHKIRRRRRPRQNERDLLRFGASEKEKQQQQQQQQQRVAPVYESLVILSDHIQTTSLGLMFRDDV